MFGKVFTPRAAPTAASPSFERAPTSQKKEKGRKNASPFTRTLNKLKLPFTRAPSDDKRTQFKNEITTETVMHIEAFTSAPRDAPNPPQGRDHHFLSKAKKLFSTRLAPSQTRCQDSPELTRQLPSAPVNPGSPKGPAPPHLRHEEPTTTPSRDLPAPQPANSDFDQTLVATAQQAQIDVIRHSKVDRISSKPASHSEVADIETHKQPRAARDERPGSWDWQFESELALQRYSVVIDDHGDVEESAGEEEENTYEPPEFLLQFWKQSAMHEARPLSWDPRWEPELELLRHSVTSEDLMRLEHERRTKAWLQPTPPKSPKEKKAFKWFAFGGGRKKTQGQLRPRRRQI